MPDQARIDELETAAPADEPPGGDRLDGLTRALRRFADDRDWGQFHTPKNLVMALAGEVGELIEHFQWLTPEQTFELTGDETSARRVADEMADVLIYLVRLADVLGIDLLDAARAKLEANDKRYPADRVRGSAEKAPPLKAPPFPAPDRREG